MRPNPKQMKAQVDLFNARHKAGAVLQVWTGVREGEGKAAVLVEPGASILSGHTAVAWFRGIGCVALSNVKWC